MDALSLILNALGTGAATSGQALASEAVKDAYTGLKSLIQRKFSGKPAAEVALTEHEKDPQTWQAPLKKALQQEHIDEDPEILKAAQMLLDQMQKTSGGKHYTQNITGNYNAQAQEGSSASVNVNTAKEP